MKMRTVAVAAMLCLAAILVPGLLHAQEQGNITGTVIDVETNEPLIGARVAVVNTTRGAVTQSDGSFTIANLKPGTYDLAITSLGYFDDTVRSVVVRVGQTGVWDVKLRPDDLGSGGETVTKRTQRSRRTEAGALDQRRNALQVSEVMSSEEISAGGASNAGDAVKRQTGTSVVGGKYVVVRGLGERYNNTQLNGVNLTSPEPEKKVVPFDLFPAGMIDNITTIKTFTPDNPGDFAGALVKIDTKDFPERFIFNAGIGTGMNTETQGADALDYQGGGTDWLGIDDGTRALPEGVPPGRNSTDAARAELLSKFNNGTWRPETASLPVNQSFNVTLGNKFGETTPIGLLASFTYGNSFSYREGTERYPQLQLNNGRHTLAYDYHTRQAEQSVLWGGLLNLSVGLGEKSKIGIKGVFNHSADDESTLVTGDYNSSTTGEVLRTQLRFTERTIAGAQVFGDHTTDFLSDESRIEWRAAVSYAGRNEPDNRQTAYLRNDATDEFRYNGNFASGNGRYFSELDDVETSLGIDWTLPIYSGDDLETDTRVKVGAIGRLRTREFTARRFFFSPGSGDQATLALAPEELYTPEYVAQGVVRFDDATFANDKYTADEGLYAGYAMIEAPLFEKLRFVGGARLELWDLTLVPVNQLINMEDTNNQAEKNVLDVLPSVNLIYGLSDRVNVRASFSQTLARPEFRELAPFRFDDYKQSTFGNPALERTRIMNYDLRWEWFPRAGELLAVSAFYKNFTNPIEQFYLLGSSDPQAEPINASGANTFGAEFEVRKGLDQIASFLSSFSVGANLTIVHSKVSFDENATVAYFNGFGVSETPVTALTSLERPLQGQSPYLVNAAIAYDNDDWGTDATLLFNVFGERLAAVGTNGIPDIYEQPRPTLDFTLRQRLPAGLQLSLKAQNLLDAETHFTQEFTGENAEIIDSQRYFSGRSLSIGVSFSLDQLRLRNATSE